MQRIGIHNICFGVDLSKYETDIASYKYMYLNATPNTFKIWILTGGAIIEFDFAEISQILDDAAIRFIDIRSILRLVGVRQVESSIISHGKPTDSE